MTDLLPVFLDEVRPYEAHLAPAHERPDPRFGRFLQDGTPRLSPSQVNLLHMCPGQWRNAYLLGLPQKQSWHADVGSIGHVAIESYLKGEDHKEVLVAAEAAVKIHLMRTPTEVFQNPPGDAVETAKRLRGAVERLMMWWESGEFRMIRTETPIQIMHDVNDHVVANEGRYDILYEEPDGRRVVGDWKFPGRRRPGVARTEYQYATATYLDAERRNRDGADAFAIIAAPQDGGDIHVDQYNHPDEKIQWARERTENAIRRVLQEDLPFDTQTPGPLCSQKWCSYYTECPAT